MDATLAVGFFDGVHLGHQSILSGADEVLTFRNHPLSILAPDRAPRLIMSFEERLAAIRSCGVMKVTAHEFTRAFSELTPGAFAARFLSRRRIRCGANWRFGRGGKGDAEFLRSLGYEVTIVPAVLSRPAASSPWNGDIISSTRIRAALEEGRIAEANAMMGRPFTVRGVPFTGKGEGRSLGYPTINLRPEELSLRLPLGVYGIEVSGRRGLANFGYAPTFGERAWKSPVLEVHFTDRLTTFNTQSSVLAVRLLRFLRPERTFASPEELKAQIAADIREIMV